MHPCIIRTSRQTPHSIPYPVLPATRRHLQSLSASSSMSLVSCDMQVGCSQACTGLPVVAANAHLESEVLAQDLQVTGRSVLHQGRHLMLPLSGISA